MSSSPAPWPRLRESWWVLALAGVAVVLFPAALVVEVRCGIGRCTGSVGERLFALDGLVGLPRLYTAGLFVAVAALAWLARRRTRDRLRVWWTAVSVMAAGLGVAKAVSVHSTATGISTVATLLGGVAVAVLALGALLLAGRRWEVASALPVVLALGGYAAVALGLDAVTSVLTALQDRVGLLSRVGATFGEEFGEGLAALLVLVTLRWQLPAVVTRSGSSTP
jgi:hypothetical protein